jgi:DNA-binding response OmpR family regulator
MLLNTTSHTPLPVPSTRWTVAVISKQSDRRVLEAVADARDCDVVLIDSFDQAYSVVRRIAPQLVIVCLDVDDFYGVEVLGMLQLDRATARIPVVTYLISERGREQTFLDGDVSLN